MRLLLFNTLLYYLIGVGFVGGFCFICSAKGIPIEQKAKPIRFSVVVFVML